MNLTFIPINETYASAILHWHYDAPYDLYNLSPDDADEHISEFLDPENGYYAILNEENDFLAYCCFGPDAWVPGGDYSSQALDIGMGVRPDLTGQGQGLIYAQAVLDFGAQTFSPTQFRVTVAQFNKRALRVWEKAGFQEKQRFQKEQTDMNFVVLARKI